MNGYRQICFYIAVIIFMSIPQIASACESCFGAKADTPVTQGIGMAMLALLLFTGCVLAGIVGFFLYMRKRAKMIATGQVAVTEQGVMIPVSEFARLSRANRDYDRSEILDHLLDKISLKGYDNMMHNEIKLLKESVK